MTDKEVVIGSFPDAIVGPSPEGEKYPMWVRCFSPKTRILGVGNTEDEAWADAAWKFSARRNLTRLRLKRDNAVRHPEDVAWLKDVLNGAGYDAIDADIQDAYGRWSEQTTASGWAGIDRGDKATYLKALLERLTPI